MRKQFEKPARLAVYLETSDLQRLTARARSEGKLLSEWAREKLLGGLGDNSGMRPEPGVPRARRGSGAVERPAKPATPPEVAIDTVKDSATGETLTRVRKLCRHGLLECTVCG